MGLINEETRNEIAETTITVVEREKGEMTEPWKFISLEIDNMETLSPRELRELGRWLVKEGKRIGKEYKSNGAKRS